jgi:serine/threonine-protein kinase
VNAFGTIIVAFITSALTAVGAVYVVQRFELLPLTSKVEQVAVPELRGLTEAEARANLKAVGLVFLSAPRESGSSVKPGLVARQSVPPGQSLPRAHPVSVALADELPKVPDVLGLSEGEATVRLAAVGYKVQLGEPIVREGAAEGKVLEQSPKGESPLEKEKAVVLRLAQVASALEMPKVAGQSVNLAKAALEKLGLKVTQRWISVSETPTFIVLSQKPEPKSKLKPGDEVELTANR